MWYVYQKDEEKELEFKWNAYKEDEAKRIFASLPEQKPRLLWNWHSNTFVKKGGDEELVKSMQEHAENNHWVHKRSKFKEVYKDAEGVYLRLIKVLNG